MHINIEFKAKVDNSILLEEKLQRCNPKYLGEDHQIDTYFNSTKGRLKLREGTIENALIHYERSNSADAKQSNVLLFQHHPSTTLKQILTVANGVKVVVDKKRKIYFIENVKFHFDTVKGLGSFIEVEAIDKDGSIGKEKLHQQCIYYKEFFGITDVQLQAKSYSDMLL